jgi:superfamily II DNA/RNA helicase
MVHHVLQVSAADKAAVVRELAAGEGRRLLFTRTKHGAKKLAAQLTKQGIPAVDLHGNLSQNARTRNLAAFADGSARVLVATDIAARGIHVDDIGLVVHVDAPAEHKAYLHRSGRTARAGAEGIVVTVATPDQQKDVRTLMRQAGIRPTVSEVSPGDDVVQALSGPAAPYVAPAPEPQAQNVSAPGTGRRSGGRGRGGASSTRSGQGRSGQARTPQGAGAGSGQGRRRRPRPTR